MIDLGVICISGRIGGRFGVCIICLMGGMFCSGILGGLGSNVDDLFFDFVLGRWVFVWFVGVVNNIVN